MEIVDEMDKGLHLIKWERCCTNNVINVRHQEAGERTSVAMEN